MKTSEAWKLVEAYRSLAKCRAGQLVYLQKNVKQAPSSGLSRAQSVKTVMRLRAATCLR